MEGCLGIVCLGSDFSISEYTAEWGFHDPPGGLVEEEVVHKSLDASIERIAGFVRWHLERKGTQ